MNMSFKSEPNRSREWFDVPNDPSTPAIHLERYTNFGISVKNAKI